MDELRTIAGKYYSVSSLETQKKVKAFVGSLDKDGNGKVDYYEFKQSLKEQGYGKYANNDLFDELDKNGDKDLDFSELIALYYIIMSARPFCYECDRFIKAEYFGCKECFENKSDPVCVCPSCYEKGSYYKKHAHDNIIPLFLDTYALLESQRMAIVESKRLAKRESERLANALEKAKLESERLANTLEKRESETQAALEMAQHYASSSSRAIVPVAGGRQGKSFTTALKIGLLTLGVAACTIM